MVTPNIWIIIPIGVMPNLVQGKLRLKSHFIYLIPMAFLGSLTAINMQQSFWKSPFVSASTAFTMSSPYTETNERGHSTQAFYCWYRMLIKLCAVYFMKIMMTSSNGNIFRVTGHLCREFTGDREPHKGQWRRALIFSLICVWIYGWVNNGEAGDLRRYQAHYDVIVMF